MAAPRRHAGKEVAGMSGEMFSPAQCDCSCAAEIRALHSDMDTLRSRINRLEREVQVMQEDLDLDY